MSKLNNGQLPNTISSKTIDNTNTINTTTTNLSISGGSSGQVLSTDGSGNLSWKSDSVTDGDKGDITVSNNGATWSIDAGAVVEADIATNAVTNTKIANDAVTYGKIQNVSAASRLLGRGSAGGLGDVEEISLGTNLSMSGTTLNASGVSDGDKGDITVSNSGITWTIDNNAVTTAKINADAVTYDKIQNITSATRLLGRGSSAGAGDVQEILLANGLSMNNTNLNVNLTSTRYNTSFGTTLNVSGSGGSAIIINQTNALTAGTYFITAQVIYGLLANANAANPMFYLQAGVTTIASTQDLAPAVTGINYIPQNVAMTAIVTVASTENLSLRCFTNTAAGYNGGVTILRDTYIGSGEAGLGFATHIIATKIG